MKAAEQGTVRARQWAGLLADAGRDTDHPILRDWGQRLRDGIHDSDLTQYITQLINDAHLGKTSLIVAFEERGEGDRLALRNDEALADFDRAIEFDASRAWAIASRGQTYQAMGRYDEALADFDRAIELDPSYGWAVGSRGQTYQAMGRYDEALTDLNRAIKLDPKSEWSIAERGETIRLMERYDDALADFNRAIELDPDDAAVIGNRGETYPSDGALRFVAHAVAPRIRPTSRPPVSAEACQGQAR